MKIKKYLLQLLIIALISLISCNQQRTVDMDKILVITGGHDFEPSFHEIFASFQDVQYDTITQPHFNNSLDHAMDKEYDALVFYDMWQDISDSQKDAFMKLLEKGQGMVFLHHSLVSYQHWNEFIKIIGGKYIDTEFYDDPNMKGSTYKEDITLDIEVFNKNHPVTKGISDFSIYDEGYQFIQMIQNIHPLLTTSHPACTPTVAWANHYKNSNIVYILLGHGQLAHENKNYRRLIRNAISWVGSKE
jgi:type 1 glutamine amidotransferase